MPKTPKPNADDHQQAARRGSYKTPIVFAPPAKRVKRRLPARPTNMDVLREVLYLRSDFVDLKEYVNHEQTIMRKAIEGKADRSDLTLFVLWKQSPTWLKIVGAIATVSGGILAAVAARLPI